MNDPRFEPVVRPPELLWRAWRVEECPESGALSLRSIYYRVTWPGNGLPLMAECRESEGHSGGVRPNGHVAPEPEHQCGIYAVATIKQCGNWANSADFPKKLAAIGEVALWGRICKRDKGVRGQFARPEWIRVLLPAPNGIDAEEVVEELAKLYCVPVHAAPPPWPVV